MAGTRIIDSHIHLWPESASDENGHSWMTPGMPLAKQHVLSDYRTASKDDSSLDGVVYVETDRRYESRTPDISQWATGPLDEVRFVRSIVEGRWGARDSEQLLGIVLWAPMDQEPNVLKTWLSLAEETAGPATWTRVKGVRFLLQAIHDQQRFQDLVLGESFITNLKLLGQRGLSFDVGVDQHSGGVWQLELVAKAMKLAHAEVDESERVCYVVNHLCKPDFSNEVGGSAYESWQQAVESISRISKTYMKLSGAFSELPHLKQTDPNNIAKRIQPWIEHVLATFGPARVMFGSDWPVCNLNGPLKASSWTSWKAVVAALIENRGLSESERSRVWSGTAAEAYQLRYYPI